MKHVFLLLCLSFFMIACSAPSLESNGGIELTLKINASDSQSASIEAISKRFKKVVPFPETVSPTISGDEVTLNLVEFTDTETVRQLSVWNRNMLLCYAVPKHLQKEIRVFLEAYLSYVDSDKPFKQSSMIGLVDETQKEMVNELIKSEEFKNRFPSVGEVFWGNKKMESKYALFLSDRNSTKIDEGMFDSIEPFASKDGKDGILGLKLLPDYADRIGKLTGNDSTYLLHILHDEVYISKIIEPHITDPSFSMSGAFSPQDALVLATIWNSPDLKNEVDVKSMVIRDPK